MGCLISSKFRPPRADKISYYKALEVCSGFEIVFAESGLDDPGFGFAVNRKGGGFFSWEWFDVSGPGVATKLQEQGTIAFTRAATPAGNEVVAMRFETDVSFRLYEQDRSVNTPPIWRINVLAGSEIHWPSLVNDESVPNGFLTE